METFNLLIELVDARVPLSSRNPDIDSLAGNKSRLVLLNKSDLADEQVTNEWVDYFNRKGLLVVKLDSRNRNGMKNIFQDNCWLHMRGGIYQRMQWQ